MKRFPSGPEKGSAVTRVPAWAAPLRWAGKVGLATAGSALALIGLASLPLSSILVRPRRKRLRHLKRPHLRALIRRLDILVEDVSITSFDQTKLSGWWMPAAAAAPTVLVLHGVNKNRTDVVRTSIILRKAGFNILVFDGRGHGESEGRFVTYGFHEKQDVEVALEWLISQKRVDRERIGLAGESMGAAIALQVAARTPWLSAVWADSPFASLKRIAEEFASQKSHIPAALLGPVLWTALRVANYRGNFDIEMVDPLALAARITCPVFMVHGTRDQLIAPAHSEAIYRALGGKKELWLVEGARHARSSRHVRCEYSQKLNRFFSETLAVSN